MLIAYDLQNISFHSLLPWTLACVFASHGTGRRDVLLPVYCRSGQAIDQLALSFR
jgi:hypothetical protein